MLAELEGGNIITRELALRQKILSKEVANLITGPRRCGKSTMAFQIASKSTFGYVNFDDERLNIDAMELNKVLDAIYSLKGDVDVLVFDEIQEVHGWEKFVSRLVGSKKLLITGSNARMLSKEFATYLTGRHTDRQLLPFSFREFMDYRKAYRSKTGVYTTLEKAQLVQLLKEYLEIGGFPLVSKLGSGFLADLYKDMVERDVAQRYHIKMTAKLSDVAKYLVSNVATEISYSRLKNTFGIASGHTIQDWISYFTSAYLLFKIERFSFKLKESSIAPKKIYAIDTGLANAVAFGFMQSMSRPMENCVAIELLRRGLYKSGSELYYWKGNAQKEVDFVVKVGKKVVQLIQVTFAGSRHEIRDRELSGLLSASSELRCNSLLVITWDYGAEETLEGKKVIFLPLWKWLLQDTG